jgi:hypothetical protein
MKRLQIYKSETLAITKFAMIGAVDFGMDADLLYIVGPAKPALLHKHWLFM